MTRPGRARPAEPGTRHPARGQDRDRRPATGGCGMSANEHSTATASWRSSRPSSRSSRMRSSTRSSTRSPDATLAARTSSAAWGAVRPAASPSDSSRSARPGYWPRTQPAARPAPAQRRPQQARDRYGDTGRQRHGSRAGELGRSGQARPRIGAGVPSDARRPGSDHGRGDARDPARRGTPAERPNGGDDCGPDLSIGLLPSGRSRRAAITRGASSRQARKTFGAARRTSGSGSLSSRKKSGHAAPTARCAASSTGRSLAEPASSHSAPPIPSSPENIENRFPPVAVAGDAVRQVTLARRSPGRCFAC